MPDAVFPMSKIWLKLKLEDHPAYQGDLCLCLSRAKKRGMMKINVHLRALLMYRTSNTSGSPESFHYYEI